MYGERYLHDFTVVNLENRRGSLVGGKLYEMHLKCILRAYLINDLAIVDGRSRNLMKNETPWPQGLVAF